MAKKRDNFSEPEEVQADIEHRSEEGSVTEPESSHEIPSITESVNNQESIESTKSNPQSEGHEIDTPEPIKDIVEQMGFLDLDRLIAAAQQQKVQKLERTKKEFYEKLSELLELAPKLGIPFTHGIGKTKGKGTYQPKVVYVNPNDPSKIWVGRGASPKWLIEYLNTFPEEERKEAKELLKRDVEQVTES